MKNSSSTVVRFVVPTLAKNLEWLELCLASVSSQPVKTDIVLVAPAGAPIASLASRYGARIMSERGSSLTEALAQGFEDLGPDIAYLGWLGDDDVLSPGSLALTVGALESDLTTSLVLGRVRYIDGSGRSKWVVRSGSWAASYARFGKNFMAQPGSLMRRDSFEEVGGLDLTLKNSMDQDLFLRLALVGRVSYLPRELAAFRVHALSISSTKGAGDESKMVSQRYAPELGWRIRWLVAGGVKLSDRVLLSSLCRIPHAQPPHRNGSPYFVA